MQFMALLYSDPASEPSPGPPEFDRMMQGDFAVSAALKEAGGVLGGDGLEGVETATSLQVRDGKVETMDGPFAETREHPGGYCLMDVPDLDTALRFRCRIRTGAGGTGG